MRSTMCSENFGLLKYDGLRIMALRDGNFTNNCKTIELEKYENPYWKKKKWNVIVATKRRDYLSIAVIYITGCMQ